MKNNCNECDNRVCGEGAKVVKERIILRAKPSIKSCYGYKPYRKPGFSLLELAISNSATEVNDLLNNAGLQFIPADTERGFHLAVV